MYLLTADAQNISVGTFGHFQEADVAMRKKQYRQNSQQTFTLGEGSVFPGTYG